MNLTKLLTISFIAFSALTVNASAKPKEKEAVLTLQTAKEIKSFNLSELEKRSDLETIIVTNDPAYPNQTRTYKAIKATALFDNIKMDEEALIQFKSLDGFSAPLTKQRLLNKDETESIAYIAIETKKDKWPELKPGKPSAGPFYLIWKNPELSKIGTEEWPFMLAGFEIKDSLEKTYPKIMPDPKFKPGLNVFVKNCFACHTMNGSGLSQIGPDLNLPMNPTEYLREAAFKKLIRNPNDVRTWPNSAMKGFSKEILSDEELESLILYLKDMAAKN